MRLARRPPAARRPLQQQPHSGPPALGPANLFFLPNGNTLGSPGGVLGGAQIGYNYQFGQFVIGAETDFQGTSISGQRQQLPLDALQVPLSAAANSYLTPIGAITGANTSLSWFGTVRGRVGYLIMPTLLIYGTGGFAYGQVDAFGFSNTATGWTAGGGAEWMFAPNWSAKVEYLYVDLSANNWNGGGLASISATTTIRSSTSCALA